MIFELWDTETNNIVGAYSSEAAALSVVRGAMEVHGEAYAQTLALVREDQNGEVTTLAMGRGLAQSARMGKRRVPREKRDHGSPHAHLRTVKLGEGWAQKRGASQSVTPSPSKRAPAKPKSSKGPMPGWVQRESTGGFKGQNTSTQHATPRKPAEGQERQRVPTAPARDKKQDH